MPKTFPPVVNIVESKNLPFIDTDFGFVFQPPAITEFIATSKTIEKIVKKVGEESVRKEYVFLGKSNVGKSSLLNQLIG